MRRQPLALLCLALLAACQNSKANSQEASSYRTDARSQEADADSLRDTRMGAIGDSSGSYEWIVDGACTGTFRYEEASLFQGTQAWSLSAHPSNDTLDVSVFITFSTAPVEGVEYDLSTVASADITVHNKSPNNSWEASTRPKLGSMLLVFEKARAMPDWSHGTLQAVLKPAATNASSAQGDVSLSVHF